MYVVPLDSWGGGWQKEKSLLLIEFIFTSLEDRIAKQMKLWYILTSLLALAESSSALFKPVLCTLCFLPFPPPFKCSALLLYLRHCMFKCHWHKRSYSTLGKPSACELWESLQSVFIRRSLCGQDHIYFYQAGNKKKSSTSLLRACLSLHCSLPRDYFPHGWYLRNCTAPLLFHSAFITDYNKIWTRKKNLGEDILLMKYWGKFSAGRAMICQSHIYLHNLQPSEHEKGPLKWR